MSNLDLIKKAQHFVHRNRAFKLLNSVVIRYTVAKSAVVMYRESVTDRGILSLFFYDTLMLCKDKTFLT